MVNLTKGQIGAIGAALAGASLVGGGLLLAKRRKTKRKSKARSVRKRNSGRKKRKGRRTPRTAGKSKDRSRKRIRYTKNGQPYILIKGGKARFIKKKSAKSSRKRKGGRY